VVGAQRPNPKLLTEIDYRAEGKVRHPFFRGHLRLGDGLLPVFVLFLPGGLFPCPRAIAALLLPFVGDSGLPLRRLVGRPGGSLLRFAAGRLADGFRWSCGGVS
jgi:hypothetical protein